MFTKLSEEQIDSKMDFIKAYTEAENNASASAVDANANVSTKNIATLEAEINKDFFIQYNRRMMTDAIRARFGEELAESYLADLGGHYIYAHDESSLRPYCVSISMYPFLLNGLRDLGGKSMAPKHLDSFTGGFINMVFAIAGQFAGAIATVEWLTYLDHFARKDHGDDYLATAKLAIDRSFTQTVYTLNQPATARGNQSVFWNVSLFDKEYFESLFGNFVFPDGDAPKWETVEKLQRYFMEWLRTERQKEVLTFPVVTVAMLSDGEKPKDHEFAQFIASEMAQGSSFFVYTSESADSLASCCRLRNELTDNTFSFSLGAGGVQTGSVNVITMNIHRIVAEALAYDRDLDAVLESLRSRLRRVHAYHVAYRDILNDMFNKGLLTVYSAGYISLKKQFSTVGINGMVEAAEAFGINVGNNQETKAFYKEILSVIYDENRKAAKEYGYMFNTEMVPAENLGVKNAAWDAKAGFKAKRECFNSYFYPVESDAINVVDKFTLHGKEIVEWLDGGSALHLNLGELPTEKSALGLLSMACKTGCNYFCVNVLMTVCDDCGHVDPSTHAVCPKCQSGKVGYATRIIGYLQRIDSFSAARKLEAARRYYH